MGTRFSTPLGALCWMFAGFVSACSPSSGAHEEALVDLEQLAFVPAGSVRLPPYYAKSEVCEIAEALLVDRYEVPRGRWLSYQTRLTLPVDPLLAAEAKTWTEETSSLPATWMSFAEARAFAASRGMRLFTAREWLRVAAGSRGLPFPWGQTRASLVANTAELGLSRPLPVGTFELGATPQSIYELSGNVSEWVEAPIDTDSPAESDPNQYAWVMGGSFATALAPLYEVDKDGRLVFQSSTLDPRSRGDDIGLRCVVGARAYLVQHAGDFGDDTATRARLVSIGRRFGRDAAPLLEELVREVPDAHALRWLLEGTSK